MELRKLYWRGPQFDADSESVIRIQNRSFGSELQSMVHSGHSVHFVTSYPGHHYTFSIAFIKSIFEGYSNCYCFSVFWSKLTPFGWYFRDVWEYELGKDWALELCQDWFDYDGKRVNFAMDLEPFMPCPCTLDQAMLDLGKYRRNLTRTNIISIGRFMPLFGCDRDGDASCEYNKGSQHCVMSVAATWTGAGQICCYDFEGWLMHSDDYENAAHLRFFSPGTAQRLDDNLLKYVFSYTHETTSNDLHYLGVTLRSPERNHNQSEILVMFDSGAGIRVAEAHGVLSVMVLLPPDFNETYMIINHYMDFTQNFRNADYFGTGLDEYGRKTLNIQQEFIDRVSQPSTLQYVGGGQRFVTVGLLGTFNENHLDDLMSPDGHITIVSHPPSEQDNINAHKFGTRWRVDGTRHKLLFQDDIKPIYNPLQFGDDRRYSPVFDPYRLQYNASLVFTLDEVRVACQNVYECEYDYFLTGRREIAMNTLEVQSKLTELKHKGSNRIMSCGALLTAPGAVKYPPGNNYLDGVTVTFTCKPEFFIHGSPQRTCINGSWTPGWHVWCRYRSLEIGLKWMTGILSSVAILLFIMGILCGCYLRRVALHPETGITFRKKETGSMSTLSTHMDEHLPSKSFGQVPISHRTQVTQPVPILRHTRSPFRAYETST
uniref:VWFD domain-containing protein n=1 Tax=Heterorhabditis bacteriophora TaxID=37862 RepID=A0A1I7X810_HETBA